MPRVLSPGWANKRLVWSSCDSFGLTIARYSYLVRPPLSPAGTGPVLRRCECIAVHYRTLIMYHGSKKQEGWSRLGLLLPPFVVPSGIASHSLCFSPIYMHIRDILTYVQQTWLRMASFDTIYSFISTSPEVLDFSWNSQPDFLHSCPVICLRPVQDVYCLGCRYSQRRTPAVLLSVCGQSVQETYCPTYCLASKKTSSKKRRLRFTRHWWIPTRLSCVIILKLVENTLFSRKKPRPRQHSYFSV